MSVPAKKRSPPPTVLPDSQLDQEMANKGKVYNGNIQDDLPKFVLSQNVRDAQKRRPDDPQYDPGTLFVPRDFFQSQTLTMQQFWKIKSENYDKVILFKLGKFYQIFFQDAIICNKLLDLRWMSGGKKLHVGFPQKVIQKYVKILVNHGHKVVVVEQTETPRQMEKRIQEEKKNNIKSTVKCKGGTKIIQRGISNIYSRGTFVERGLDDEEAAENKYSLAIVENGDMIGVSIFDVNTLTVYIGQFDWNADQIKTMILILKPAEIIMDKFNRINRTEFNKILKSLPLPPVINLIQSWGHFRVEQQLNEMFGSNWPGALAQIQNDFSEFQQLSNSLGLLLHFMDNLRLTDNTIKLSQFKVYSQSIIKNKTMILDAVAIQSLDILYNSNSLATSPKEAEVGSLFHFLNYTSTPYGRRMLRNWICSPLRSVQKI